MLAPMSARASDRLTSISVPSLYLYLNVPVEPPSTTTALQVLVLPLVFCILVSTLNPRNALSWLNSLSVHPTEAHARACRSAQIGRHWVTSASSALFWACLHRMPCNETSFLVATPRCSAMSPRLPCRFADTEYCACVLFKIFGIVPPMYSICSHTSPEHSDPKHTRELMEYHTRFDWDELT